MKNAFISIFFVFLFSCNVINGTKNLGNGYFYDTGSIVYAEKETYDGAGFAVIPEKVLSFVFDDNFIIVSSLKYNHEKAFWIIDKQKEKRKIKYVESNEIFNGYHKYSNIFGPMDKSEFTTKKKELGINLKFE